MFALAIALCAHLVSRLPSALLASATIATGVCALVQSIFAVAGVTHATAQLTVLSVAWLVFVFSSGWAFVAPTLGHVWLWLGGGGAVLWAAARILASLAA